MQEADSGFMFTQKKECDEVINSRQVCDCAGEVQP
jgi:hypothetical protein